MSIKKALGLRIRELRRKSGFTQEHFAELIGVAPRHVSRIENGVNSPSVETLGHIAECLNVEVKELFSFRYVQTESFIRNDINDILNSLNFDELLKVNKVLQALFR